MARAGLQLDRAGRMIIEADFECRGTPTYSMFLGDAATFLR